MRPLLFALGLLLAAPTQAQVEGVGYRLTPSASYVDFEPDAALGDGLLYGGGLGFSFGEFIELGGAVQIGSFETDLAALGGLPDSLAGPLALLAPRDVRVQRYGGALKVNVLRTPVVPYVTLGTGVVRLAPEGLEATRSIYLLGGVGVQATVADRFALSLAAEDVAFRFNPGSAFFTEADAASGLTAEAVGQRTAHNLGLRAAASVYLGGRRPGRLTDTDRALRQQFSGGLSGLSLVVEPFYGRVDFDDAFAYRDQTFVGAEAGFDFGPLVGVRAFYGRGTRTGVPTDIEGVQMVGGDLRLRLSEGQGLVPFLSVGGGYLDVLDGYATDDATGEGALAEDAPFAAAGVGAGFLLSPRLRAIAEVRGLLLSTQDVDDLSGPENVYLNTFLRAGVSVGIGGRSGRRVAAVRASDADAERAMFDANVAALRAYRDSLRTEVAALEAERAAARRRAVVRETARLADLDARLAEARAAGDSLALVRLGAEQDALRARIAEQEALLTEADSRARDVAVEEIQVEREVLEEEVVEAEHMVTIPLPREGELYVRYGPPGGVVIQDGPGALPEADLRAAVRAALLDVLAADPATTTLTEGDVAAIEQRIVDRLLGAPPAATTVTLEDLERMERRLEDRLLDALRAALAERDGAE